MRRLPVSSIVVALLWCAACLPHPQSVKERRESFDRAALKGELILDAPPANMTKVGAVFGNRMRLLGYTLDPPHPKRGDNVEARFYWEAIKTIDEDFQCFVHGDAVGGNARRIHADHFPAKGQYSTDLWIPGEVIVDPFKFSISSDYGASMLGIYTGMYKGNYRVPLTDAGDAQRDSENRSRAIEIRF